MTANILNSLEKKVITLPKGTLAPAYWGKTFLSSPDYQLFFFQVWNSNAVADEFMGQVVLPGSPKDSQQKLKLQLRKRGSNMADEMPGSIILCIATDTELTAI